IQIEGEIKPDFEKIIERSRNVAANMSKGIQYLFKKNKIDHINGFGKVKPGKIVEVTDENGEVTEYKCENIIIATGARSKQLPNLKQDGKKIIGYREALSLPKQPKSMVIVGSGAIGSEFAYFYNSIGTQVTLVEFLPEIVPLEDIEVSKQLGRSFKKSKIKVMKKSTVKSVDTNGKLCKVLVETKKGEEIIEAEIVLSAVGVTTNIQGIGLEETGIEIKNEKVVVDDFYKTNIDGYFAIGDIVHGPALAHVASHEGIVCVEKIAGKNPETVDYGNIPACTYTSPEVASVGLTEQAALDSGKEIKVGKFPFKASGKATAAGANDGFVKVVFDAETNLWLGAHMIGDNVTELIAEVVAARKLGAKAHDIINTIHPHPTMSEAVMEAVADAYD
ncbi:MAG: dihydrolipoyl dehydrogenase, partial [Bacteroidales bacterium]|nr:dihydrolipoyl dehydrogenase [Bacteroidales bacterium]